MNVAFSSRFAKYRRFRCETAADTSFSLAMNTGTTTSTENSFGIFSKFLANTGVSCKNNENSPFVRRYATFDNAKTESIAAGIPKTKLPTAKKTPAEIPKKTTENARI